MGRLGRGTEGGDEVSHPYDGYGGLTPDEQDEMERTMIERIADWIWCAFIVGGAIGGWSAVVRLAVWGW